MSDRFICRASQAKNLLTKDNSRKEGTWGLTALQVIKDSALFEVFGFINQTASKYTIKGIENEDNSIELLNNLNFSSYEKNSTRLKDEWFTGECDILADDHIRDIKTVWSLASFPFTESELEKKVKESGYDYQGQVYMHLYDRPVHYIDFVLLPTPMEQLKYASEQEIYMLHELPKTIPAEKRVITYKVERDDSIIETLKGRVEQAQPHFLEYLKVMR